MIFVESLKLTMLEPAITDFVIPGSTPCSAITSGNKNPTEIIDKTRTDTREIDFDIVKLCPFIFYQ